MKKPSEFLRYVFTIFTPKWKDKWLDFFIKSIIAFILWLIIMIISFMIIDFIMFYLNYLEATIYVNIIIWVLIMFTLQLFVASKRFRDIWRNQWILVLYFLSIYTWIFWIIYWLYLCFAKSKIDNNSL
jgi:uncharacterized membrane protein YhaH (DUF805 family)